MTHVPKVTHKIYFMPKIFLPEFAIRYGGHIHVHDRRLCMVITTPLYKPRGAQGVISRPLTGSECLSTWPSQTCRVCAINNGPNCTNKNQISTVLFTVKRKL